MFIRTIAIGDAIVRIIVSCLLIAVLESNVSASPVAQATIPDRVTSSPVIHSTEAPATVSQSMSDIKQLLAFKGPTVSLLASVYLTSAIKMAHILHIKPFTLFVS